jgi:hypothetical protein
MIAPSILIIIIYPSRSFLHGAIVMIESPHPSQYEQTARKLTPNTPHSTLQARSQTALSRIIRRSTRCRSYPPSRLLLSEKKRSPYSYILGLWTVQQINQSHLLPFTSNSLTLAASQPGAQFAAAAAASGLGRSGRGAAVVVVVACSMCRVSSPCVSITMASSRLRP